MLIVEPGFAGFDTAKRRLPALLKLSGYEPIVGVVGRIASFGKRGFVAGLLQIQFKHLPSLRFAFAMHALRLQCCFDRHGRHGAQNLLRDRSVSSTAIGGHASGSRQHEVRTVATVDMITDATADINDAQAATAMTTGKHAGQKSPSAGVGAGKQRQAHFVL